MLSDLMYNSCKKPWSQNKTCTSKQNGRRRDTKQKVITRGRSSLPVEALVITAENVLPSNPELYLFFKYNIGKTKSENPFIN